MNFEYISTPGSQVDSTLPGYIAEQYEKFVKFMEVAAESESRIGFSQDLLQNLQKYRDFDTYRKPIVEFTYLSQKFSDNTESTDVTYLSALKDESNRKFDTNIGPQGIDTTVYLLAQYQDEKLVLFSGDGFPEKNGVLLIDEEVILYRRREGNVCYNLQRGASATTTLGNLLKESVYKSTEPQIHYSGAKVYNLSGLFMSALLDSIHKSFLQPIDSKRVADPIDRAAVLENIRDFFQSKGTKLGIKALFKILFAENDVDVFYPGDRMIIPSKSTWYEGMLLRVIPVPFTISDPEYPYILPDKLIGNEMVLKSYNDNIIYGTIFIDYASHYTFEDESQYELYVEKDNIVGETIANPKTVLTRNLQMYGTEVDGRDVFTITVETTLGFPDAGILVIEGEAIKYEYKSFNQFHNCSRGYIGVDSAYDYGTTVMGPYYYEGKTTIDGVEYLSRAFPLGLARDVEVFDPGLLHELTDDVTPNGPGRVDPREPIMGSFIENYDDALATQSLDLETINYIGNYTAGVSGVYFDNSHVFVSTSHLPYDTIGPFSRTDIDVLSDESFLLLNTTDTSKTLVLNSKNSNTAIGPELLPSNNLNVIPRRGSILANEQIMVKGTDAIGLFVDGVPAYSNVSPHQVVQGSITKYKLEDRGINYITPTLVVDDEKIDETIEVINGEIVSISNDIKENYITDPEVRISSGEYADFSFLFDKFGRVTEVIIISGGRFYYDTPVLTAMDSSGRGKGAVFGITVSDGEVTDVKIVHPGIDYDPDTTRPVLTPVGSGAVVDAHIQYYQFDRHYQITNTRDWFYDENTGFVFEDKDLIHRNFAYIIRPLKLSEFLEDYDLPVGSMKHSPILGWAYDGNPIYGPYGYADKVDETHGIVHYRSSYVLRPDRSEIIASGGDNDTVGTLPPSESTYPMGTFVEDYDYDPEAALDKLKRREIINSEIPEKIKTENNFWLAYGRLPDKINGQYPGLLDEYNSVVCNTPEFPKELYPDGVRCYFLTVDYDYEPEFPYIIGHTFYNRPISQNLNYVTNEVMYPLNTVVYDVASSYDDTRLVFDYDHVERFRNRYLSSTKDELDVEIVDVLDGSISEILVESGLPFSTKVGDITYYDNEGSGGAGAEGRVSFIEGEKVVKAEGEDIKTIVLSHVQIIRVSSCVLLDPQGEPIDYDRSHVFVRGSIVQSSSGAQSVVYSYDEETTDVTVITYTKNLIQFGDNIRDNRGQLILIPNLEDIDSMAAFNDFLLLTEEQLMILSEDDQQVIDLFSRVPDRNPSKYKGIRRSKTGGNTTYFGMVEPDTELNDLNPSDLWYSNRTGRLYIYYIDEDSTGQWVCTQPIGKFPLVGALNEGIGLNEENDRGFEKPQKDNIVTISKWAPSERGDGSAPQYGDLWWSPQTGIMYMWYEEQWICTDPNATVPTVGALDVPNWYTPERIHPWKHHYETAITIIIKLTQPRVKPDGEPLEDGVLWWSPVTGKMYIRYTGENGPQWIITNPVGMLPNEFALDTSAPEDGGGWGPPLKPGPILPPDADLSDLLSLAGINYMWFEQLKYFYPEDIIRFYIGAPGTGPTETAKIISIAERGAPAAAVVRRGDPFIPDLPDRTPTYNKTRSLFKITTDTPHLMRVDDIVYIENSIHEDLNNKYHTVVDSGFVIPAEGYGVVENGEVVDVVITNKGAYYTSNFYIGFYGGGGVGGYAYVEVDPIVYGGSVKNVTVEYGGMHYESNAKLIWPPGLDRNQFAIFTPTTLPEDSTIKYSTNSVHPMNKARFIEVTSPGYQYDRMPSIVGLYKKGIDRAEVQIEMSGQKIRAINVLDKGNRYHSPKVIINDRTNMGYGAEAVAVVESGKVERIDVIKPGDLYVEPFIDLVEDSGKYISLTEDIGKIKAFDVIDPGRRISPDRSLRPELHITSRLVLRNVTGKFLKGDLVYQGLDDYRLVEATIVDYDDATQILTVDYITGEFKPGDNVYSFDASGYVAIEGQADCRVIVDGVASPKGQFLDDTSKLSEVYPVIQDSYYYQWFSYVVSSPIEQIKYDSMVKKVIHPSGFIMFSDLTIHDFVVQAYKTNDVEFV